MGLRTRASRRLSWLSINIGLNVVAASVIAAFQQTLSHAIALAVFLPIISDMSGCSGNQAVAVSMRELSWCGAASRRLLRLDEGDLGWRGQRPGARHPPRGSRLALARKPLARPRRRSRALCEHHDRSLAGRRRPAGPNRPEHRPRACEWAGIDDGDGPLWVPSRSWTGDRDATATRLDLESCGGGRGEDGCSERSTGRADGSSQSLCERAMSDSRPAFGSPS